MIRNANVYTLKENYTSRALAAVLGDKDQNRFLVGTYGLKITNDIYFLNFNDLDNKIVCEGLLAHHEEIYNISACPYDRNKLITSYRADTGDWKATLYDMNFLSEGNL